MLEPFAALLIEGRRPETSRRRSEAWRPAAAARNRSPREARDPRPPGTTTWLRGARCTDPGHAGDGSAAPGAQNRHGGAPRGERPASWDARRLASAWPAASCAGPTGASHAPERFSALRPPLDSGLVKQSCKARAQKRVAGTRWAV